MLRLHTIALAIGAVVALCATQVRADGDDRGSAYLPFSWTGLYVGANAGIGWSDSGITDVDGFAASAAPGTVTRHSQEGFTAGGQGGYNRQSGPLVLGIEADFGYMGIGRSRLLTGSESDTRVGEDSGAYGDLTGRMGIAADRTLFYAKAGWGFFNGGEQFSTAAPFTVGTPRGVFSGWTLGGGIEHAIKGSWSVKLEYQHFDFGTEDFALAPGTFRFRDDLQVDTVKLGFNYKYDAHEESRPLK